jgi:hypothetical protein
VVELTLLQIDLRRSERTVVAEILVLKMKWMNIKDKIQLKLRHSVKFLVLCIKSQGHLGGSIRI